MCGEPALRQNPHRHDREEDDDRPGPVGQKEQVESWPDQPRTAHRLQMRNRSAAPWFWPVALLPSRERRDGCYGWDRHRRKSRPESPESLAFPDTYESVDMVRPVAVMYSPR